MTDWDTFELSDESYHRLMRYPGVHTISLGRKEVAGVLTDVYAVQVLVARKLPPEELDPDDVVPGEIQGVPTDVVEEQEAHLVAATCPTDEDTTKVRPLVGGVQVQARHCGTPDGAGTLGCIARTRDTNQKVLLSNAHVLGEKDGDVGDDVGQPGMCSVCSGCCSDPVATVLRVKLTPHVDGAIAALNTGIDGDAQIKEIGAVAGVRHLSRAEAMAGTVQVQKRGRTTGLTFGTVVGWIPQKSIKDHRGNEHRLATDSLRIVPRAPSACWVQGGDSGSAVLDTDRNVVALLFGGTDDGQAGLACPIQFVEDELNIEILTSTAAAPVTTTTISENVLAGVPVHPDVRVLAGTPGGGAVIGLMERHAGEIRRLVRGQRRVTAVWRRNRGPGILQALADALTSPGARLPAEVEGHSVDECVARIGAAIRQYATPALRADLDRHLPALIGSAGLTLEQVSERLAAGSEVG